MTQAEAWTALVHSGLLFWGCGWNLEFAMWASLSRPTGETMAGAPANYQTCEWDQLRWSSSCGAFGYMRTRDRAQVSPAQVTNPQNHKQQQNHCFKPLSFEVVSYSGIRNWHSLAPTISKELQINKEWTKPNRKMDKRLEQAFHKRR